jgi:hypothetical protein
MIFRSQALTAEDVDDEEDDDDDDSMILWSNLFDSVLSGDESWDEDEEEDEEGDVRDEVPEEYEDGMERALSMSSSTTTALLRTFCQSMQGAVLPVRLKDDESPLSGTKVVPRSTTSFSLLSFDCRWFPLITFCEGEEESTPLTI